MKLKDRDWERLLKDKFFPRNLLVLKIGLNSIPTKFLPLLLNVRNFDVRMILARRLDVEHLPHLLKALEKEHYWRLAEVFNDEEFSDQRRMLCIIFDRIKKEHIPDHLLNQYQHYIISEILES